MGEVFWKGESKGVKIVFLQGLVFKFSKIAKRVALLRLV
jgi:hypothetical protein